MSDEEIGVIYGMMLSVQAILKEASVKLSHDGSIVGSPQYEARAELSTALAAITMAHHWIKKINVT